jgi:predicted O-methyltransferase YrrM
MKVWAVTPTLIAGGDAVRAPPSTRRLTHLALAGWGAAIVATTALLALKVISAAMAVTVIVAVTLLTALAALLAMAVRVDQRVARLTRSLEHHMQDDRTRTAELGTSLVKLADHVGTARERVSQDVLTAYRQLEAMVDLRALLSPRAPLPPLRGWALSPDALRLVMREVFARQPQLIVECGSGSSSVWLGYTVQRLGIGRVVALEHDERFLSLTRDLLLAHGLDDVVEIRHAPLSPWDGGTGSGVQPWYDVGAVEDLDKIGLLLVDGPPATLGEAARYPALPALLPKCADHALIVLDDTVRAQESEISDRWLAEHPELRRTVHEFEKGLHLFERAPRA